MNNYAKAQILVRCRYYIINLMLFLFIITGGMKVIDMSYLHSYNLELLFTYYAFDLCSEERDSEFVMGFDYDISWEEIYEANEIVSQE